MMRLLSQIRSHPTVKRLRSRIAEHRLVVALCLVVVIAIGLAITSVTLYYRSGFYRFDLSRPGYEHERSEISKPTTEKAYDTTSPVTQVTVDEFLQEFDSHQADLQAYGDFRDSSLSDEDLQISN
jgi:hypothetical protein